MYIILSQEYFIGDIYSSIEEVFADGCSPRSEDSNHVRLNRQTG